MTDLHARLTQAVEERKQRALAAADASGGPEWRVGPPARCQCCDTVVGPRGHQVITEDDRLTAFIAAEDPAFVLCQVARDERVLARHRPHPEDPTACFRCTRLSDEHVAYPCVEACDLADALGVEIGETT